MVYSSSRNRNGLAFSLSIDSVVLEGESRFSFSWLSKAFRILGKPLCSFDLFRSSLLFSLLAIGFELKLLHFLGNKSHSDIEKRAKAVPVGFKNRVT